MIPTGDVLEELKHQLAQEDLEQARAGKAFPCDVSPAGFLQQVLAVEAAQ